MIFHDDELDEELKNKLSLIATIPVRSLKNAARGREVFMNKAKEFHTRKAPFVTAQPTNQSFLQSFFKKRLSFAPFAIALIIAIGLVLGGWGTVYAAQDSLPNDFLYPVKIAVENINLTFTVNPNTKVALLTTYTGTRIDEAAYLVSQGQQIPEELPNRVDDQLDELFTLAASLDEESMEAALTGVQRHLRPRDQIQSMTNKMQNLPQGADPQLTRLLAMLKERHQMAQTGLETPLTFQQQFKHQLGKPALPITPTLTSTLTSTITSTLTSTPEITVTLTITNGHYGPGPCENPGDCTPPGPFGTPIPGEPNGFGPGPDQGVGPNQPTVTPINDNNKGNKLKNGSKP